jgi:cell division septation protein DedD
MKKASPHNAAGAGTMVKRILCTAALILCPLAAVAQPAAVNPAFVRAQTLVNDGNAAGGRAIVDSMLALAAPGSNDYAEAIYWRGVFAATAADAEMDYRRIVVDHPLSPRVEDALIRLAQLELARANYDGALRHLNRLVAEHPQSPARARAGYWMARALFDKNDVQGGCTATTDALARVGETDPELRNQISYLNQRCAGVVLGAPPATTTPTVAPPPSPTPTRDSATVVTVAPTPAPAPPPTRAIPLPPPPAPVETPRNDPPATAPTGSGSWSVQVAAYNVRSQADAAVARLKKNGYEARVDGGAAPFRVRIGRYQTQAQASAVQRSLKAKKIEGFVVQVDTR